MQQMVAHEPALAWAVSWMPLYDQLDLTLELLRKVGVTYLEEEPGEPLPSNVIPFEYGGLASGHWDLPAAFV
jgi:hypothetical protein